MVAIFKYHLGVYFNGAFSVTAWVYYYAFNSNNIFMAFQNGNTNEVTNDTLAFSCTNNFYLSSYPGINGSGNSVFASGYTMKTNIWYHIGITYDGSKIIMHINGSNINSGPLYSPNNVIRNSNYIGKSVWTVPYSNAIYDDINI